MRLGGLRRKNGDAMSWLPVLLVCIAGNCEFIAGDHYWSAKECEKVVLAAATELQKQGATVVGACIQIRIT